MAILGIDPGTRKCGYAVIETIGGVPLELGIVPTETLGDRVRELVARFAPSRIALGGGTHARVVEPMIAGHGIAIEIVDERETTLLARRRYFSMHPPRGWRRFVPRGMLLPPRPIDDFAALLIAERLLAGTALQA
jgi:RNase H-fold protein (predicted Holliday junction resolvase)